MSDALLLRRRAEQLARPAAPAAAQTLELMVFTVGAALYAVPLEVVRGVLTTTVTPIPGVQPWVAGLINVRGEIRSVLDADVLLGQNASPAASSCVMLLETRHGVVGWLLSARPQLQSVNATELGPPLSVQTGVTGVVMGTIALLDIAALLESLT